MQQKQLTCFIIMPITTPEFYIDTYKGDKDHFAHVLEHLFKPALEAANFDPIPPKSKGSDVIQAEIIKHLASADLVLCDMSILNPNVFFELGIRTALNKPVALVIDDKAQSIPFDTSIINFLRYESALNVWSTLKEIIALTAHVKAAFDQSKSFNALWKYFGVVQTGVFKPEEASIGEKIDLLIQKVTTLESVQQLQQVQLENPYSSFVSPMVGSGKYGFISHLTDNPRDQKEKIEQEENTINVIKTLLDLKEEREMTKKKSPLGG